MIQYVQSLHYNDIVKERNECPQGKRFYYGESGQQHKIERMAMTFPEEKTKIDEGGEKGEVNGPCAEQESVEQCTA